MIQEDYVNFEIAKLLKEKGFPIGEFHKGLIGTFKGIAVSKITKEMIEKEMLSCIPQSVVMKWLREVHNLHICIFIGEDYSTDADGNTVDKWQFWTYNITNIYGDMVYDAYDKFDCTEYQSYEEACEAAIKYCLTNLI